MLYPVFDFSAYSFKTPIKNIKHFFFDLKCCRDRILKGYCEKDMWDMDVWFLTVIPDLLDLFEKKTNGIPSEFVEAVSIELYGKSSEEMLYNTEKNFTDDEKSYKRISELAFARWQGTLKEMSCLFREAYAGYQNYKPSDYQKECRKSYGTFQ